MRIFCGDLTAPHFGLADDDYDRLIHTTDSVIHCAASLNRKSEKSCLNVNLRGTLEVLLLAPRVSVTEKASGGPRRYGPDPL
jgi:thioester reductase-like protein